MFIIFPMLISLIQIIIKLIQLNTDSINISKSLKYLSVIHLLIFNIFIISASIFVNYYLSINITYNGMGILLSLVFAYFVYKLSDYCNIKIVKHLFRNHFD